MFFKEKGNYYKVELIILRKEKIGFLNVILFLFVFSYKVL